MHLEFSDASFQYRRRDKPVFEDLTITFEQGRTVLLGPNGAGKSTLLAVAASVLNLDRGRVSFDGLSPRGRRSRAAYRRRVTWMAQTTRPAAGLSVREQVALHGWLSGQNRADAWNNSISALERVDLVDHANMRASKLSGGQRSRMGLAQALVHQSDAMLLDEPTAALDPDQKQTFVDLLSELSHGLVVVVSTHDVSDLELSYEQVVVMTHGAVRYQGATHDFLRRGDEKLTAVEAYRTVVGTQ